MQDENGLRVSEEAVVTLVAGLNSHRQLCDLHTKDVKSFEPKLKVLATFPGAGKLFFASWSTTLLQGAANPGSLLSYGYGKIEDDLNRNHKRLRNAIGDHNGLKACLDDDGYLYINEAITRHDYQQIQLRSSEASPRLSFLALAQNGRVALTLGQAPDSKSCYIIEFVSFETFLKWFDNPTKGDVCAEKHNVLSGRPKQLLGGVATFMLLMEDGDVYTWGDARHQSLGRAVTGKSGFSAGNPTAVDALGGLKIVKIASGGWISAALSEDRALFLWGNTPGSPNTINALHREPGSGDVNLVQLPNSALEPLDVLDVAVGHGHIAVLTDGQRLFVCGDNSHGQLGLDSDRAHFEDWEEVQNKSILHSSHIRGIDAGPRCTFLYVDELGGSS